MSLANTSSARRRMQAATASVLGLLALQTAAHGATVQFGFQGTITRLTDPATYLPDAIQTGQTVSGTILYETAGLSDVFPDDLTDGVYRFEGPSAGNLVITASIETPGHTYALTHTVPAVSGVNAIQANLGSSDHSLFYYAWDASLDGVPLNATSNGSLLSFDLFDGTKTALASDALPLSAPNRSAFNEEEGVVLNVIGYKLGGVFEYGFAVDIASITPIPETGAIPTLVGAGLCAFAFWHRRNRSASAPRA